MKIPKRRSVSGIIAAVFLFVMLFTVGTSYFMFIDSVNTLSDQAYLTRVNQQNSARLENLFLTTTLLSNGHIGVYGNNTGGIGVNITSLYVFDAGTKIMCEGIGMPTGLGCINGSPFPAYVNPGMGTPIFDTGVTPVSGHKYTVTIVTAKGSTFSTTYPGGNIVQNAMNAIASGAIGDLYISFHSFKWYTITTCNGSNWCLNLQGPGFSIPASSTNSYIAFSISVTNLNSLQKNITLDPYTYLTQFIPCTTGCGSQPTKTWFIVSNSSTVLYPYSPITLLYNQPVTLVFASDSPGILTFSAPKFPSNTVTFGFIVSHGCICLTQSRCTTTTDNYGQVAPYISTLYY